MARAKKTSKRKTKKKVTKKTPKRRTKKKVTKRGSSKFVDAQAMHRAHPKTFDVPTQKKLDAIDEGYFVKVAAKVGGADNPDTERFWIKVTQRKGQRLTGVVENDLGWADVHGLKLGDKVTVSTKNVYDVMTPRRRNPQDTEFFDEPPTAGVDTRVWGPEVLEGTAANARGEFPPQKLAVLHDFDFYNVGWQRAEEARAANRGGEPRSSQKNPHSGWTVEKFEGVQLGYRTGLGGPGRGRRVGEYVVSHPEHLPNGKHVNTRKQVVEYLVEQWDVPEGDAKDLLKTLQPASKRKLKNRLMR